MKNFWKKSHRRSHVLWLIALLVFVGGNTPVTAETLYISKLASYTAPEKVREKVRTECTPEIQLPLVMREEIMKRTSIQQVVPTDEPSAVKNGLAITFSILSLNIPPGAGYNTEKRTMKVKSVVYRNGAMAAEYVRYSDHQGGGGKFGPGACTDVERLARDIGVHTAGWLMTMKLFQEAASTTLDPKR